MITDAILTVLLAPLAWLLDLVPSVTWPSWVAGLAGRATSWGADVATLNGWFPVVEFVQALGFLVIVFGVCLATRIVRFAVSLFTGGGGA